MKKIIALTLSLMMLLTCAVVFAEAAEKQSITMTGAFSISYDKLPEYYAMQKLSDNKMEFTALLSSTDAAKPQLYLSIKFDDQWSEANTLEDITEEEMLALKDSFYRVSELDEGDLLFTEAETGMGTKLLVVRDVNGSAGAVFCIYMSHEVEIDLFPGAAGNPVTEEDLQAVIQFITDIEFTPVEAAK